ncbi:hypothetical protein HID58_051970 [Brassica napus]|uniref:Uncharacterized protein n=1 Tax=Brassica napus TaxID=3708 RepID=A0ABQ8AAG9_BRANA|nr:hypothetical protein HID58_051970 [Brassica napus]
MKIRSILSKEDSFRRLLSNGYLDEYNEDEMSLDVDGWFRRECTLASSCNKEGMSFFCSQGPRNSKKQVRGFSMSCMLDQVCSLAYLPTHVNQIINGLEHVVEGSTEAKRIHVVAIAFTVGVWFSNNVYGGMEFVDWA